MTEEIKDTLRNGVLPVLLDHRLAAHRLASKMLHRYGISSVLCGRRRGWLDWLDPFTGFWQLFREGDPRLAVEQLIALAERQEDCLLLLIPVTESDRRFLCEHAEALEPYFVIVDAQSLAKGESLCGFLSFSCIRI